MTKILKKRLSATISASLMNQIRKTSKEEEIPQSSVVEQAVRFWLAKRLEEDAQFLSRFSFDDLPSEDDWLAIQAPL